MQLTGKEHRVVCYLPNYAVFPRYRFRSWKLDGSLCTHIMFAYNVLNETTLLHQKPDPTQDVDGINIDFFPIF
jgi:hypothetical protein